MKFLLCFVLVFAMAIAKPAEEVENVQGTSKSNGIKNETALNHRVERNNDQTFSESESEDKEPTIDYNADLKSMDDKSKNAYDSSQLTSTHNADSSYPARSTSAKSYGSVVSAYPSLLHSSYGTNGLGSYWQNGLGSYGSLESSGIGYSSYPSAFYGSGLGSYGYLGSNGLSGSYGYLGSNGLSVTNGLAASNGLLGSYGLTGSSGLYSSVPAPVIPTSYSSYIPKHCGVNIAQQIIHKPIVTELQEVIHKPIISEVQEIVNKPVLSEVQQVIHKPLYTEHIGLGPSYQGYLKHIVKQPVYQKPCKQFVHHPMYHAGTIHLGDEYEHAVTTTTTHSLYPPVGYSHGLTTGTSFPAFTSGISAVQPNSVYRPEVSVSNIASYQPAMYSSATPVSMNYSPLLHTSLPLNYASIPSATTSFGYPSLMPYNCGPLRSGSTQRAAIFDTGDENSYVNMVDKLQPKAAEQIIYDEFQPYNKQQLNSNQQYYNNQFPQQLSGSQQQQERSSNEDFKTIKMNVDAIVKQIEKNPEMKKQLIKIITESMYATDQTKQDNKKQQDPNKSLSPVKFD